MTTTETSRLIREDIEKLKGTIKDLNPNLKDEYAEKIAERKKPYFERERSNLIYLEGEVKRVNNLQPLTTQEEQALIYAQEATRLVKENKLKVPVDLPENTKIIVRLPEEGRNVVGVVYGSKCPPEGSLQGDCYDYFIFAIEYDLGHERKHRIIMPQGPE